MSNTISNGLIKTTVTVGSGLAQNLRNNYPMTTSRKPYAHRSIIDSEGRP